MQILTPEVLEVLNTALVAVLIALLGALSLAARKLIALGSGKLIAWLDAKARETESKAHLAALTCVTEKLETWSTAAVAEVEQTLVRQLKRDDKWNDTTARLARDTAVDIMRRHAGPLGMAELKQCTGLAQEVIEGMFRTWIEKKVASMGTASNPLSPKRPVVPLGID